MAFLSDCQLGPRMRSMAAHTFAGMGAWCTVTCATPAWGTPVTAPFSRAEEALVGTCAFHRHDFAQYLRLLVLTYVIAPGTPAPTWCVCGPLHTRPSVIRTRLSYIHAATHAPFCRYPRAHVVRVLGRLNDLRAESEAVLVQCGINHKVGGRRHRHEHPIPPAHLLSQHVLGLPACPHRLHLNTSSLATAAIRGGPAQTYP